MKIPLFLLPLLIWLACQGELLGQQAVVKKLDAYLQAHVEVNHFNGNVLVAKSGKIIYQKAFGYRNYTTKEPLDNQSVFELASISKQFTTTAILLLAEQGKLTLSDTLRKFFPQLPYQGITLHELLLHTSGLPDYQEAFGQRWDHQKVAFNQDLIAFLAREKLPLDFKPGARWQYANVGYELLASIVEQVSGQSFGDYLQEQVFKPLGMKHTRLYNTRRSLKEIIPNYAYGYLYEDSLQQYVLPDSLPALDFVRYFDGIQGAGGISSTTGDLLRWDRALKHHTLLSNTTQQLLERPQVLVDTLAGVYWNYGSQKLGSNEIGDFIHSGVGSWPGYSTDLIRYLKADLVIIVLSNNESKAGLISGGLAYLMTDREVVLPYLHRAVPYLLLNSTLT